MTPKPTFFLLKCIFFCHLLAMITVGCQKTHPATPNPDPINTIAHPDTTIISKTTPPIDSVMMLYVGITRE